MQPPGEPVAEHSSNCNNGTGNFNTRRRIPLLAEQEIHFHQADNPDLARVKALKRARRRPGRLFWGAHVSPSLHSAELRPVNNTHSSNTSCTYNRLALESQGCVRGIGSHAAHTLPLSAWAQPAIIPTSLQTTAFTHKYTGMQLPYLLTLLLLLFYLGSFSPCVPHIKSFIPCHWAKISSYCCSWK